MKKILSILLIIILLTASYYYFIKANNKVISVSTDLKPITICGKQYYINDSLLNDSNIMPMILKIINYNYEHDDIKKPTSNPVDNPTEYMRYDVRPFAIASSTCSALAKSYNGKELRIHDIKNTAQVKSFYIDNIIFYVYPNQNKTIDIDYDPNPNDQSGFSGPRELNIK